MSLQIKKGAHKGQFVEVVKRKIPLETISSVSLRYLYCILLSCLLYYIVSSPLQDDFFVIHVQSDFDSVLESVLKTEFLTLLSEKYKHLTQNQMRFTFSRK